MWELAIQTLLIANSRWSPGTASGLQFSARRHLEISRFLSRTATSQKDRRASTFVQWDERLTGRNCSYDYVQRNSDVHLSTEVHRKCIRKCNSTVHLTASVHCKRKRSRKEEEAKPKVCPSPIEKKESGVLLLAQPKGELLCSVADVKDKSRMKTTVKQQCV